jgi:hypothetical protein
MLRTKKGKCLENEPCWRVLGTLHRLAKGRAGVAVGVSKMAKAAKVSDAEGRRLAAYLAGMYLVTFDRGRVALTRAGLSNAARGRW